MPQGRKIKEEKHPLVQLALSYAELYKSPESHVDLAISVLKGEVTFGQASFALSGIKGGGTGVYVTLWRAIMQAYKQGLIKEI